MYEPKHLTVSTVDIYLGGWRQDGKVHHLPVKNCPALNLSPFYFPAYSGGTRFLFALEKKLFL